MIAAIVPHDRTRWLACLVVVLVVHGAIMALVLHQAVPNSTAEPAPALLLDLMPDPMPEPVAPPIPAAPAPPQPAQPAAPASPAPQPPVPEPPPELPPPEPVPLLPEPIPPPQPTAMPKPPKPPPAVVKARPPAPPSPPRPNPPPAPQATTAPQAAIAPSTVTLPDTTAPVPTASASQAEALSWEGRLQAHLARAKRYPADAQMRHQEGVPMARIVMNRAGAVLSVRLERSSGVASLDAEALALVERAQPLPAPPPGHAGQGVIDIVVPLQFRLRR